MLSHDVGGEDLAQNCAPTDPIIKMPLLSPITLRIT